MGHSHPKIAEVAEKQFKNLNTNTRYIDETIVQYAKTLTDKLPESLEVCFFTNSGSESNDLALRLARTATNSKETIVLDGAYHGHVSSLIDISPYKHNSRGGSGPPSYVHTVPMPDSYRGKYRGEEALTGYIDELKNILYSIKKNGKNISAFVVESIMGCGGQLILPDRFLERAFELVRDEGGVCIADEVQIGFGRMGTNFWGFETENVVPDIVTMGKSMGNGHPLSAVVTTKKIADLFDNGMEYFNSFGGNPVSCAVGHAVLNVIKDEELQKNALDVGLYLKERLNDLKEQFPIIGDVRGRGLFLGVELVKNENLLPAKTEAHSIVNQMKENNILLSIDGPFNNVIKIKPPIIFSKSNCDLFLKYFSEILNEDFIAKY